MDALRLRYIFTLVIITLVTGTLSANTPEDEEFRRTVRTGLRKHCGSCHNEADKKAGINLEAFDFVVHVVRRGELFEKVVETLENRTMPPPSVSRITNAERDSMIAGIRKVLDRALLDPDPGPTVMRRLSHREYGYTIQDLIGVEFDGRAYFPSEASGGAGFDNQGRLLYLTPLLMERYYSAADSILRSAKAKPEIWKKLLPDNYRPNLFRRLLNRIKLRTGSKTIRWKKPVVYARKIIIPFALKAYRRILTAEEEEDLISFFSDVYFQEWQNKNGFEVAITTTLKKILIAPSFLFRIEANQPINKPYAVNNFELASRLSYLLWSSMPDDSLLTAAYREDLQDSAILTRETKRMMANPKFKRFSQTFAPQWLGIEDILLPAKVDVEKYPSFTTSLKSAMYEEVTEYFHFVFNNGNLLRLIDSDFSFLNGELAQHYGVSGIEGSEIRKVSLVDQNRGGVLGMGAILTATSLPGRTSPVLRGQWVLNEMLGVKIPPPPPDVPELTDAKQRVQSELDLRALLEQHRSPSSCQGCHQKMDGIGFGLENFDAIGRWRTEYAQGIAIDSYGTLEDGTGFEGPAQLKKILLEQQDKFARTFARKLLSYALGRSVEFLDSPALKELSQGLLESDFNGREAMISLVTSYPFRHRRSDMVTRYIAEAQ